MEAVIWTILTKLRYIFCAYYLNNPLFSLDIGWLLATLQSEMHFDF